MIPECFITSSHICSKCTKNFCLNSLFYYGNFVLLFGSQGNFSIVFYNFEAQFHGTVATLMRLERPLWHPTLRRRWIFILRSKYVCHWFTFRSTRQVMKPLKGLILREENIQISNDTTHHNKQYSSKDISPVFLSFFTFHAKEMFYGTVYSLPFRETVAESQSL